MEKSSKKMVPKWIWILFLISFPGSAFYALEIIYEMTILTWKNGLQNVGFSLIHNQSLLFLFFVVSLLILCVWIIILIVWVFINFRILIFSRKFIASFTISIVLLLFFLFLEDFYNLSKRTITRFSSKDNHALEFFIEAASGGDIKSVNFYLNRSIEINKQDENGRTALMGACVGKQKETIEFLIKKGADISKIDRFGFTALKEAISEGNIEIAKLLIDKGADISPLKNVLRYDSAYYTTNNEKYKRNFPNLKKQDSIINILLKEQIQKSH
jgi:hypothetical protein